jgi:hypothetical protein
MSTTPALMTARKPWVRPAVEKIAAGQAEAGTRNNRQDADLQTS